MCVCVCVCVCDMSLYLKNPPPPILSSLIILSSPCHCCYSCTVRQTRQLTKEQFQSGYLEYILACPYDVLVFHYCCPGYAQVANEAVTQAGPAAAQPRLRSLANDLREFMRDTRLEDWMEEHGGWVS